MNDETIVRLRELVASRYGLVFDDSRAAMLADLIRRRAQAASVTGAAWVSQLEREPPALRELVSELTVSETSFFRHKEMLRALTDQALPALMREGPRASRAPLRVISVGCSSGEEPATLAILLQDHPLRIGRELFLRAIDVNPAVLERARTGRYSDWALRDTPPEMKARWFRAGGTWSGQGQWALDPAILRQIDYEERNLVDEDPVLWAAGAWDIVFCRNVLMYLHPELQARVVERFARSLVPGGALFLGHAETLRGLSNAFHLRQSPGAFWYQRREEAGQPVLCPPAPIRPGAPPRAILLEGSWMEIIEGASARIQKLAPPVQAGTVLQAGAGPARESEGGLLLRAVLTTNEGDLAMAERLCQELLAIDELNAGAHYLMALCREGAGDLEGALEHDRSAQYLDPSFAMPWLHQGLLARKMGDVPVALRALDQALALLPREDPARILLFGGGFGRDSLMALCRGERRACGGGR